MAINIADLEAKILLTVDGGTNLVQSIKSASDAYERFAKFVEANPASKALSSNGAQQREAFQSVAQTLRNDLTSAYSRVIATANQLSSAGVDTSSLLRPIQLLTSQANLASNALDTLQKRYKDSALWKSAQIGVGDFGGIKTTGTSAVNTAVDAAVREMRDFYEALRKAQERLTAAIPQQRLGPPPIQAAITSAALPTDALKGQQQAVDSLRASEAALRRSTEQLRQEQEQLARGLEAVNQQTQRAKQQHDTYIEALKRIRQEEAQRSAAQRQATQDAQAANTAQQAQAAAQERAAQAANAAAQAARRQADAQAAANNEFRRQAATLNNITSLHAAMSGPLGQLTGRFVALQQSVEQVGGAWTAFGIGASAGVAALVGFFNAAIKAERTLGPIKELFLQLGKVSGEDGKKNFEEMTAIMIKYGLSIETVSKPLARLKIATEGTALGGEKFKSFAEDFAAVVSKFALPQDAIAGVAKALEQMISKGTVQLEEFKNQLGDRFPAALRVGLVAFREYSGDAEATMKDFFKATKGGSIESVRFIEIWMQKTKEMFGINNDATNNLNASYGRLSGVYTMMIQRLDQSVGATRAWMSVLSNLTSVLQSVTQYADIIGPIATAAFGVVAVAGVMRLLSALGLVQTRLLTMRTGLIAVGVAAGALALFSNGARAAEMSVSELSKRGADLNEEIARVGNSFSRWGQVGEVVTDAKSRMEMLKMETAQVRMMLDASSAGGNWLHNAQAKVREWADSMGIASNSTGELGRRIREMLGAQSVGELQEILRRNEAAMRQLQNVVETLEPKQKAFAAATNSADRELEALLRTAGNTSSMKNIEGAIGEVNKKIEMLRDKGLEALRVYEAIEAARGKYSTGGVDSSTPAGDEEVRRLVERERVLAEARSKAQASARRDNSMLAGGELSKAEGIIQRAEAIIEGAGLTTGNSIRKMIKDLKDYQEALVATGMTNEEAAKKVDQFKVALEMQAAGVNLASLQLKPLQAMQKGMESFADTLAGLLVDGKLNAKSFADAFKQMAASIVKDIIAMTIKANIVRPLLMGIFGAGGGSTFGMGGLFGTQPVAFAKGGVVDDPTMFGFGGGRTGLMGEAGAEAIMPLRRGPDGSLGVAMHDTGGGGQPVNITFNVSSPDAGSFMKSEAQVAAMLSRVASRGSRNG